jgi:hypothetical protein
MLNSPSVTAICWIASAPAGLMLCPPSLSAGRDLVHEGEDESPVVVAAQTNQGRQ